MPMAGKTTPNPDLKNNHKTSHTLHPTQRLLGWVGATAIAFGAVVVTSQTDIGNERLEQVVAYLNEPVRAVAQLPPRELAAEAENRRLSAEVRALTADRERLGARIRVLEQNLQDMTGSIKKQSAELEAARTAMAPPPPAITVPTIAPPPTKPAIVAGVAPAADPVPPDLPPLTPPRPDRAHTCASRRACDRAGAHAAGARCQCAGEPARRPPAPTKIEYGIDLGSATSLEALRIHWAAVKANYGPQLVGLHPVISHYKRQGGGVTYRLIAGPVPTVAAARELCTRFRTLRTGCRPAKFAGAQLAEH
jgi:hypothetical protein